MDSATSKTRRGTAPKREDLTLRPHVSTYAQEHPGIPANPGVNAEMTLTVKEENVRVRVRMEVESRELAIREGLAIHARLEIPNYELLEKAADSWSDPIPVELEDLETLGRALVRLGREAKRYGFLPAASEKVRAG